MNWAAELLRLTYMPVAMGIFLLAAQASGGLVVRDEINAHLVMK